MHTRIKRTNDLMNQSINEQTWHANSFDGKMKVKNEMGKEEGKRERERTKSNGLKKNLIKIKYCVCFLSLNLYVCSGRSGRSVFLFLLCPILFN